MLQNRELLLDEIFILTGIDFDDPSTDEYVPQYLDLIERCRLGALWCLKVGQTIVAYRCSLTESNEHGGANKHHEFLHDYMVCGSDEMRQDVFIDNFLRKDRNRFRRLKIDVSGQFFKSLYVLSGK